MGKTMIHIGHILNLCYKRGPQIPRKKGNKEVNE